MATRRPAEVFPPGDFLSEELEERGWSQTDLAAVLGRPVTVVSAIIKGKRRITPDTAAGLAAALGTSPEFWMNLDAIYQLDRVNSKDSGAVARRAKLYAKAPVRELIRRGWIEPSDNIDVLERRVLSFLGVNSIDEEPEFFRHAARKSTSYDDCTPAQLAWLIRARQLAKLCQAARYSPARLKQALERLRMLAHTPQETRHVSRVLAEAGVRLVIVQPLPGGKIDGATFWLDQHSPVVAISLRLDRLDNFWFTLLHELKHVAEGEMAIDTDLDEPRDDDARGPHERKADEFASDYFITKAQLDSFIVRVRPLYSAQRVEAFALTMRVHPAIVVGQLQHRREVAWSSFRKLLVPVRAIITASTVTDGWGSELPAGL